MQRLSGAVNVHVVYGHPIRIRRRDTCFSSSQVWTFSCRMRSRNISGEKPSLKPLRASFIVFTPWVSASLDHIEWDKGRTASYAFARERPGHISREKSDHSTSAPPAHLLQRRRSSCIDTASSRCPESGCQGTGMTLPFIYLIFQAVSASVVIDL